MKKIHYLAFAFLTLAGAVLSILLVPGKSELALIHFKDKEYEVARRSYEERFMAGDRSVSVVIPLTQLYLQFGDVEKAVQLMESFVDENPNDVAALKRLGKFFQYAERPHDYLTILERIAALEPGEAYFRELSDIYNFNAQYEKQIEILKTLIDKYPNRPQDFIDLAKLEATNGSIVEAEATMRRFEAIHPEAMMAETTELHVNLLLDAGKPQTALTLASKGIKRENNYETVVHFADLLNFKKQPALALRLVEPYDKAADNYPTLLRSIVLLWIGNGKSAEAYARLKRLHTAGALPEIVVEPLVDLALQYREIDFAISIGEEYDLTILPNWLLAGLAEAALSQQKKDFLARMVSELGDGFLNQNPVLAAQLALARNDATSALRWIERADKDSTLEMGQRITLATLYVSLGRRDDALRCYQEAASRPDVPDYVFLQLAGLYMEQQKAEQGLKLLEPLRAKRHSTDFETAWALLAAAAGRGDDVLAWLASANALKLSVQSFSDIYFAAMEAAQPKLAVAVAERLYRQRHSADDQLHLVNALMAASRPAEALKYLRPLLANGTSRDGGDLSEKEQIYVAALNAALEAGEPVSAELKSFWSRRLGQSHLPESKREEIVYALLDLKDDAAVLPILEQFAKTKDSQWLFAFVDASLRAGKKDRLLQFLQTEVSRKDLNLTAREKYLRLLIEQGGDALALSFLRQFADEDIDEWLQVYEETLARLDRKRELIDFVRDRAKRVAVSDAERRSIASRLLELGDKRSAEQELLKLAAAAPPDSPDVSQLLYLWGPRPGLAALDWLEQRGRSASGASRAAWMRHLINLGSASRAVRLVTKEVATDRSVVDAYIDALVAVDDRSVLGNVLDSAVERESDPAGLRRFGRIAMENGNANTARLAFEKLLRARPDDRQGLKRLGSIALWQGNFSVARRMLTRLDDLGGSDYESRFYLGEILTHDHDPAARRQYQRSLEMLEASKDQTIAAKTIQAQLLERLGKKEESLAYFKALLKERPHDGNVRNDYVAALLHAGRYEAARQILDSKN